MESLFGWVTTDEQEKEIVKEREKKRLCTTGKQINIIKKALASQIIRALGEGGQGGGRTLDQQSP